MKASKFGPSQKFVVQRHFVSALVTKGLAPGCLAFGPTPHSESEEDNLGLFTGPQQLCGDV